MIKLDGPDIFTKNSQLIRPSLFELVINAYLDNEIPYENFSDLLTAFIQSFRNDASNLSLDCVTLGVRACKFPFTYKNKTYTSCTTEGHTHPWCATTTTKGGKNYVSSWGNCEKNKTCVGKGE